MLTLLWLAGKVLGYGRATTTIATREMERERARATTRDDELGGAYEERRADELNARAPAVLVLMSL
jgi:hypothetical protein